MLRALAALAMNQMELRLYAEKVARLERAERTIGQQLREANERLRQSEERFRDYFEEAPIAYVVSSKSGIIRANRTAAEILGVKPEEIVGFDWRSLFHDNPDAQRRLREVLKLVQSGNEARGEELELRRKEDGRPLAVRWWSKSEAGQLLANHVHRHYRTGADGTAKGAARGPERLPARRNSHRTKFRRHRRRKFRPEKGDAAGSTRCADRCYRPDHRGKRYRKGARRAGHPRAKRPTRTPTGQTELQRGT